MAYRDFTITEVKRRFQLRIEENRDLFASIPAVEISPLLSEILAENIPMALAIGTVKVRCERIIAPVLPEARRRVGRPLGFFSGVEFTVDPRRGLTGTCAFLLGRSPERFAIEAPAIAIVAARKEDMIAGIGRCLAEMVGARVFHGQNEQVEETIYGVVTTGHDWKSLRPAGDEARIDRAEYDINQTGRVVGILEAMLLGTAG